MPLWPSIWTNRSPSLWPGRWPCPPRFAGTTLLTHPRWAHLLALSLFAVLAGCGGARFNGQVYRGEGLAFRVGAVPPAWRRIDTSQGLLAFRDDEQSATVLVNGRCGKDADDVPLSALTQHLFLMFTDRNIEEEENVPFDGREARRTVLSAKLDGVPKRFEAVVLKKDGCVYDFVLISEPASFAQARPGFDQFVSGFHAETP
jgi:hypothetical protein